MRKHISILILIFLALSLVTGQILAQDGSDEDEFYTGYMGDDVSDDRYTIFLEAGQSVIITAEAADGSDLDTLIALENPSGTIIEQNDDNPSGGTLNSQIIFVAQEAGDYTVIMSNFSGTSGNYELTISYTDGDNATTQTDGIFGNNDGDSVTTQTSGNNEDESYTGFIDDDTTDRYTISLEAGQGVVITAEASSGSDLDTYLILEDSSGREIEENDDSEPGVTLNSQISFVAVEAGEYTIVMTNYPGSSGDYELTISYVDGESIVSDEIDTTPERDADQVFTGTIGSDEVAVEYPIQLQAGQGVIIALYETDNTMDTLITLRDPDGVDILVNDDRGDYNTLDSQIAFTAQVGGEYTIIAGNYPDSPGDYRLEIYFATPEEVSLAEQALREVLSGPVEIYDTPNFRIHYTLEGEDASDIAFVEAVAQTVEEVYDIQVNQLGWVAPPNDIAQGGDSRYDVYLLNILDVYGYASSSSPLGDNPNTPEIEEFAAAGYLVLDNDYSGYDDPIQAMRATTAHEFHHVVQFGYDKDEVFSWYFEATASWMETVTFPSQEEATIYVADALDYPEICLGGEGDADPTGLGIYGAWLFFEFMQTTLGDSAPLELWENIATLDEWEALEATLAPYGETISSFVAQYNVNNLVRDYLFVSDFQSTTVAMEAVIENTGNWTFTGEGVQELASNFFELALAGGVYDVAFASQDGELELYAIGISGDVGEVIPLGSGGTIDTSGYDYTYVMVFNTAYDNDISECSYFDYSFDVSAGSGTPLSATTTVNASEFSPLD